ncbi:MAG TPA: hypothetical protein VMZ26_17255 [Pyrinomonadaceae bacterium]|nr:hypothetical protein [Pyrinomonadaceae bacterium]
MDVILKTVDFSRCFSPRCFLQIGAWMLLAFGTIVIAQTTDGTVVAPKRPAIRVFEIGKVTRREFAKKWTRANWAFNDWVNPLYIINYGTNREIAQREKVITDSIKSRNFDRNRITLVRGGPAGGPKTVVWKIPPGADNPAP